MTTTTKLLWVALAGAIIFVTVVMVLSFQDDDSAPSVDYDAEGFDENGCNRGESYDDGLCEPVGNCAEASDALDAYDQEHGFDMNETDAQIDEYNRLVDDYNENC